MIRILVVDDQNLVQQGIKSLLDRDMELKVIGTVRDGRNALKQIAQIHPDIVLLDIEMPGMDGITTTKYINQVSPNTKVIILSSHEEKKYVTQALMAGAKGYILKSSLMTDLKQAILSVNNGYSQIDSRLLAKVFNPQNIKAKKSKVSSGDVTKQKNDLEGKNSAKSVSDRHDATQKNRDEVRQVQSDRSDNTIDKPKIYANEVPQKFPQANSLEPQTANSDNHEKSTKHQPISTASQAWTTKKETRKETFAPDRSDAVVLKKLDREAHVNHTFDYETTSAHTQTTLTPVKEKSSTEEQHQLKITPVTPVTQNKRKKVSTPTDFGTKLLAYSKISIQKLKVNRLVSNTNQYIDTIVSAIARKIRQNLWWNVALVLLGILVVIILGRF